MNKLPPRPSLEHHVDHYTIRKEDEHGNVTFETGQRWLHLPHVLTAEEAMTRQNQEDEAYVEDAARHEANKTKVRELTKHSDPSIAFLAKQLLTKL